MSPSGPPPIGLEVRWTSRPPGVRLTGALGASTGVALERCLAELDARYRGRVVLVDLAAVTSVSLASVALLVAVADRARRNGGELRLRLSPALERSCGRTVREGTPAPPHRHPHPQP